MTNPEEKNMDNIARSVLLYQASHAGTDSTPPSMGELIDWLLENDAYHLAYELKERLEWIHNKLVDYGNVNPDADLTIPGRDILLLRILSESP